MHSLGAMHSVEPSLDVNGMHSLDAKWGGAACIQLSLHLSIHLMPTARGFQMPTARARRSPQCDFPCRRWHGAVGPERAGVLRMVAGKAGLGLPRGSAPPEVASCHQF